MKFTVELQPFAVPDFVFQKVAPRPRSDGFFSAPKLALSELDDETLEALCKQFRDDVFAKARKER